jgi:hypothetical protein
MIDGSRYRGSRYAPPVPVFSISAARQATTSTYAWRSSSFQRSIPVPPRNSIGALRMCRNALS